MIQWKMGQWFSLEVERGHFALAISERVSVPIVALTSMCLLLYAITQYGRIEVDGSQA
jgi:hypothetical protein